MAFKAIFYELLSLQRQNRKQIEEWPNGCPKWLIDVMETFIAEFDNNEFEIGELLKVFRKNDN